MSWTNSPCRKAPGIALRKIPLAIALAWGCLGGVDWARGDFIASIKFGDDKHDGGAGDPTFALKANGLFFKEGVALFENAYYKIVPVDAKESILRERTFLVNVGSTFTPENIEVKGVALTNVKITFKKNFGHATDPDSRMVFYQTIVAPNKIDKAGVMLGANTISYPAFEPAHFTKIQLDGYIDDLTFIGAVQQAHSGKTFGVGLTPNPATDGKKNLDIAAGAHELKGVLFFLAVEKDSTLTLAQSGDVGMAMVPEPASSTLLGMGMLMVLGYTWRRRQQVRTE